MPRRRRCTSPAERPLSSDRLNPEVARLCNRRKIAYWPGCGSASEIRRGGGTGGRRSSRCSRATRWAGRISSRRSWGPCPGRASCRPAASRRPRESITAWFKAGVAAVGIGSNLITKAVCDGQLCGHHRAAPHRCWHGSARGASPRRYRMRAILLDPESGHYEPECDRYRAARIAMAIPVTYKDCKPADACRYDARSPSAR